MDGIGGVPASNRRAVGDGQHDRRRRQFDALHRHVGGRASGEQIVTGERDGDRQRRLVRDLDERAPAAVGNGPHALHRVTARDPHACLEDRRSMQPDLADGDLRVR